MVRAGDVAVCPDFKLRRRSLHRERLRFALERNRRRGDEHELAGHRRILADFNEGVRAGTGRVTLLRRRGDLHHGPCTIAAKPTREIDMRVLGADDVQVVVRDARTEERFAHHVAVNEKPASVVEEIECAVPVGHADDPRAVVEIDGILQPHAGATILRVERTIDVYRKPRMVVAGVGAVHVQLRTLADVQSARHGSASESEVRRAGFDVERTVHVDRRRARDGEVAVCLEDGIGTNGDRALPRRAGTGVDNDCLIFRDGQGLAPTRSRRRVCGIGPRRESCTRRGRKGQNCREGRACRDLANQSNNTSETRGFRLPPRSVADQFFHRFSSL